MLSSDVGVSNETGRANCFSNKDRNRYDQDHRHQSTCQVPDVEVFGNPSFLQLFEPSDRFRRHAERYRFPLAGHSQEVDDPPFEGSYEGSSPEIAVLRFRSVCWEYSANDGVGTFVSENEP